VLSFGLAVAVEGREVLHRIPMCRRTGGLGCLCPHLQNYSEMPSAVYPTDHLRGVGVRLVMKTYVELKLAVVGGGNLLWLMGLHQTDRQIQEGEEAGMCMVIGRLWGAAASC
jgi:hypothetical protein